MSPAAVFIIQLGALAVLGSYLILKHRHRVLRLPPPDTSDWTGKGLDVSRLQPRISRLRRDYLSELVPAPDGGRFRRGLVAYARRKLGRLRFFSARSEDNLSEHSAGSG
jgi:hypothetical protein